jgi:2-polyprenyl-3-methyl-5-hydroxy-6-metoxy-1,4-benzoquinol methylase
MLNPNTDAEWEKFCVAHPYCSVATNPKFHKANLTAEHRNDFFKIGAEHVADVVRTIKQNIDPQFSPRLSLDFGCGVGRLLVPIADFSE